MFIILPRLSRGMDYIFILILIRRWRVVSTESPIQSRFPRYSHNSFYNFRVHRYSHIYSENYFSESQQIYDLILVAGVTFCPYNGHSGAPNFTNLTDCASLRLLRVPTKRAVFPHLASRNVYSSPLLT